MSPAEATQLNSIFEFANQMREVRGTEIRDKIVHRIYLDAEQIANKVISKSHAKKVDWDKKIDDIVTSRWLGFPIMLLLLGLIFWLTITGANYPSQALAALFFWGEERLTELFVWAGAPGWLHGVLVLGMYRCVAWVVAVMLPPMAIFFPLFTLLEDSGYLPRVAFNLDNVLRKAGTHGKQALTMSMGFGCNAAGIVACRIIESPREKLIAMLTNNFVPCNGRFPTLIAMAFLFTGTAVAAAYQTAAAAVAVVAIVLVGIGTTLLVSYILSITILAGMPSTFTLELPPYRKPLIGQLIIRSVLDRTIFVLGRAVSVAAPAGVIIWLLANIKIADASLLAQLSGLLDPVGRMLGLDGVILMAFILGLPANELVLPLLIMGYVATGSLVELNSIVALKSLLVDQHGWTWLTALCLMLFSVLHYPCATTLITINRETKSIKWTLLAALIPLTVACTVCFAVAQTARLMGLV